jgi:Siphovirus ReqiPepy6 Gp37-like protein
MEVLILDKLLRPIDVVDTFESIVFAERRKELGDFQLVTLSTPANKNRFVPNTWVTINKSRRVMVVETIEESIDDEQRNILTIKGQEITKVLQRRAALKAIAGPGVAPVWVIEDQPADVMRYIFREICVLGTVTADDIIPFIQDGLTQYPASTIPEFPSVIEWEQKPASVFAAEKELADIFDLGFRLYRDLNASKLYFDVYAGSDLTTAQSTNVPVVFSYDVENLQNTRELRDISNEYNVIQVVYVYKDVTETEVALTVEVFDVDGIPPEGFDRKTKVLTISSIPEEITDIPAFMYRAGLDELMKSRPIGALDGEVSKNSQYIYETHYYLGDVVELRSSSGASSYMTVEEYIFAEDLNGEKSYPTFTTRKFIDPGTWASWKYDKEWTAMGSGEYWANQ